jgi:hypothetical protein
MANAIMRALKREQWVGTAPARALDFRVERCVRLVCGGYIYVGREKDLPRAPRSIG